VFAVVLPVAFTFYLFFRGPSRVEISRGCIRLSYLGGIWKRTVSDPEHFDVQHQRVGGKMPHWERKLILKHQDQRPVVLARVKDLDADAQVFVPLQAAMERVLRDDSVL
jgi:hypothetical protein